MRTKKQLTSGKTNTYDQMKPDYYTKGRQGSQSLSLE